MLGGAARPRPHQAVRLNPPFRTIGARRDFLAANGAKRAAMPGSCSWCGRAATTIGRCASASPLPRKIGNAVVRKPHEAPPPRAGPRRAAAPWLAGADHVLIGRAGGVERDFAALSAELAQGAGEGGAGVTRLLILLIRAWQAGPSRILPPTCRYAPSCSAYAIEALSRYGALRGGWLAARRLAGCHPWGGHGFDPVPRQD